VTRARPITSCPKPAAAHRRRLVGIVIPVQQPHVPILRSRARRMLKPPAPGPAGRLAETARRPLTGIEGVQPFLLPARGGLTGATVGAAAGGAAGAAAYGRGCRSSTAGCSWTGLAAAAGQTAAGGAITGAAFATAGGALSSAAARGSVAPEEGGSRILFGQRSVSRTFTTAENGSDFKYAGMKISDAAGGLRNGSISPDELPIQYAVNNRSLLALVRAGLQPTVTIDVSDDARLVSRVEGRLAEMGGSPSQVIRVRGAGPDASYFDPMP
jgi:hypothetical protein